MRKLSRFTMIVLLCGISQHTYAKTAHWDTIAGLPKVVDMYKRHDAVHQPKFITYKTGVALLEQVNSYYNSDITYTNDKEGIDYWQTPKETNERRKGDCEDYAIAKWQALLDNGIPETDMYFMSGKHKLLPQDHVLLLVILDGKLYYLDNTSTDITKSNISETANLTINRFGFNVYVDDIPLKTGK